MIIDGEKWTSVFPSLDEAIRISFNQPHENDVVRTASNILTDEMGLLLVAINADRYERAEEACEVLSLKLVPKLDCDPLLIEGALRKIANIPQRYRQIDHANRLSTNRKQVSNWFNLVKAWVSAALPYATDQLERELIDIGMLHY
ncbi:hypothetical protein MMIC_P0880 [Mariprofundus micogutta]|uniref:Uncharacterized protein n=1 Tax=Mariprofundus micogutta TaxID=1921010 RepID=A0A1L8CLY6_9PROT|nr:hypothetical protein [Mariprofundus micogutta]GAV19921.1 hypothetical protein MMIC_P0880 [Mariprofundus micogutta]